ncbi:MAG: glycosyltransferase family 2 protein [Anaerolineae bacterium]
MVALDFSIITLFFAVFGIGYLVGLVYVLSSVKRRVAEEGEASDHLFSLIIPARDEEAVIGSTLQSLLALRYPGDQFEILVVDDGSTDGTAKVVREVRRNSRDRIHLLGVPKEVSGRGKPVVLNTGYAWLRERSRFRGDSRWIIGVFDADGRPDPDMLRKASYQFRDSQVAGVQATVRIRNQRATWLAGMQQVEFGAFARMTQFIRMRIARSASMGGNGQFVRTTALDGVALDEAAGIFWDPRSLTEDLELAARLALRNWDLHHLHTTSVSQEGVERLPALLRQRVRWAWGSLQVFVSYVLRLRVLRAPKVRLRKRIDLLVNLSLFLVSPLVLVVWVAMALALIGLLQVVNVFPALFMILLAFSYLPIVGYGLVSLDGYRKAHLPLDLIGFIIYTYHWIPSLVIGLWHLAAGHLPTWSKTSRTEGSLLRKTDELLQP